MADFKLVDEYIATMHEGLSSLKDDLDATEDSQFEANRGNVGHSGMQSAIEHYLERMARFKNRYRSDVDSLNQCLRSAQTGSDEIDAKMRASLVQQ